MRPRSQKRILLRVFRQNKTSVIGSILTLFIVTVAIAAPLLSAHPSHQEVSRKLEPPSWSHIFGMDAYGRDLFTRIIWGARISLSVGTLSVLLALIFGTAIGMIGGYKGGWIDQLVLRYIDIFMSFPLLVMGMFVLAIMGPGLSRIIFAIGFTMISRVARLARASTLSLKEIDFVQAARAVGQSDSKIIILHILPNLLGDVIVMGALWVAQAILVESSLSFVGLGIGPPTPSWGVMIRDGMDQITTAPHISIFPGLAISLTVFSFNLVADGLRDISDPKLRG